MHNVGHHAADALRRRRPEHVDTRGRQIFFTQQPGPHGIVYVVVHVGDDVGDPGDLSFDRACAMFRIRADRHSALALGMTGDAIPHFPRQVQPPAVVLEDVDDAKALLVVVEAAGDEVVEHALAGVAEGRVAEVVAEGDGLGQFLVESKHLGDAARDLRHLERMGQARSIVIAGRREEHLGLVLQPPEGLAVNHAITIALEGRPDRIFGLAA